MAAPYAAYGLGGVWMLRTIHEDADMCMHSGRALAFAVTVAALWPVVVVWGEVSYFRGRDDA